MRPKPAPRGKGRRHAKLAAPGHESLRSTKKDFKAGDEIESRTTGRRGRVVWSQFNVMSNQLTYCIDWVTGVRTAGNPHQQLKKVVA